MNEVRAARAEDRATIATTLARAFEDDPVFGWIIPGAAARARRMPRLFDRFFETDMRLGSILTAGDGRAASLWRAPGRAINPKSEVVKSLPTLLGVFGTGIGRALAVSGAIETHHPKDGRFLYAHFVGVRPEDQGTGLGAAMMRTGIARSEAEGVPIYLETARPANVGFYMALGFRVTGEWDVPKGGPHFWSMMHGG